MTNPLATSGSRIVTPTAPTVNVPAHRAKIEEQFTLADVDPIGRIEVMDYGAPGSGKTVLASTFPGPLRWLAADGQSSLKSLRWAYTSGLTAIKNLKDVVAYAPTEQPKGRYIDTAQAFNLMNDMIDYWFSAADVDNWETLVLDSFTEINTWALDLGLGLNSQFPKPDRPLSGSDKINRAAMTRLVTGEQDYKSAMGLIEGTLRNIRTAAARHNKNLVILCHEWKDYIEKDDGTNIVTAVQPLLIGQLRTRLVKDFDDVWYNEKFTGASGPEIKVNMHGTSIVVGKSRWGSIIPKATEPDFRKMIAMVKKFHNIP